MGPSPLIEFNGLDEPLDPVPQIAEGPGNGVLYPFPFDGFFRDEAGTGKAHIEIIQNEESARFQVAPDALQDGVVVLLPVKIAEAGEEVEDAVKPLAQLEVEHVALHEGEPLLAGMVRAGVVDAVCAEVHPHHTVAEAGGGGGVPTLPTGEVQKVEVGPAEMAVQVGNESGGLTPAAVSVKTMVVRAVEPRFIPRGKGILRHVLRAGG